MLKRSGVARQTLYRHFDSKQNLVIAFLERREEIWTKRWLQEEVESRATDPAERLLVIFDVFDEWFQEAEFEGCSFINVMLEHPDTEDPINRAGVEYLAHIRSFLRELADAAGVADPDDFARQWHILMKGSIVSAGEGRPRGRDAGAADRDPAAAGRRGPAGRFASRLLEAGRGLPARAQAAAHLLASPPQLARRVRTHRPRMRADRPVVLADRGLELAAMRAAGVAGAPVQTVPVPDQPAPGLGVQVGAEQQLLQLRLQSPPRLVVRLGAAELALEEDSDRHRRRCGA